MSEHDCTTPVRPNTLTADLLRQLFHYNPETGIFTKISQKYVRYGKAIGSLGHEGYRRISVNGKRYQAHHLAWLYVYGSWPEKPITHRNCVLSDDRVDNLAYVETQKLDNPRELTADQLRQYLNYCPDTGEFTRKVGVSDTDICNAAGHTNRKGYVQIGLLGRLHQAHRLAWLYVYGVWPKDQIDHINRNRADNRIVNLREADYRINSQNKGTPRNNTSGTVGIYWNKPSSKWQASIRVSRRNVSLGYYSTIEDAIAARKAAEKLYWADTNLG